MPSSLSISARGAQESRLAFESRFGRLSVRVRQGRRQEISNVETRMYAPTGLDTVLLYVTRDSADPNLLGERNPGDGVSRFGLMRFKGAESGSQRDML